MKEIESEVWFFKCFPTPRKLRENAIYSPTVSIPAV